MRRSSSPRDYPRDVDIRAALLGRANEYGKVTGLPHSAIGKRAVNDSAFLFRVAKGRNVTLRSYQRCMNWFDRHWPAPFYKRQKKKSTRLKRRNGAMRRRNGG